LKFNYHDDFSDFDIKMDQWSIRVNNFKTRQTVTKILGLLTTELNFSAANCSVPMAFDPTLHSHLIREYTGI